MWTPKLIIKTTIKPEWIFEHTLQIIVGLVNLSLPKRQVTNLGISVWGMGWNMSIESIQVVQWYTIIVWEQDIIATV